MLLVTYRMARSASLVPASTPRRNYAWTRSCRQTRQRTSSRPHGGARLRSPAHPDSRQSRWTASLGSGARPPARGRGAAGHGSVWKRDPVRDLRGTLYGCPVRTVHRAAGLQALGDTGVRWLGPVRRSARRPARRYRTARNAGTARRRHRADGRAGAPVSARPATSPVSPPARSPSPGVRGCSLRHAYATTARKEGAPLEGAQDSMDHADPRSTRGYDRDPARLVGARYARDRHRYIRRPDHSGRLSASGTSDEDQHRVRRDKHLRPGDGPLAEVAAAISDESGVRKRDPRRPV